jgi:hypothetical protein
MKAFFVFQDKMERQKELESVVSDGNESTHSWEANIPSSITGI